MTLNPNSAFRATPEPGQNVALAGAGLPGRDRQLASVVADHRLRRSAEEMMTPYRKNFVTMVGMLLQELPTYPVLEVFYAIGYQAGEGVVQELSDYDSKNELNNAFQQCLDFSDASGFTRFTQAELEINLDENRFDARLGMLSSIESDAYLAIPHPQKLRVCTMESGYLSGVATALAGQAVEFTETRCRGEGAKQCEFVGKLVRDGHHADEKDTASGAAKVPAPLMPLVGKSSVMQTLRSRISVVAGTAAPVVIQGETGTGKELIARSLHMMSNRDKQPLITMNCAAIPENLVEAELFGVQKGAYTGADRTRMGKFQLAHEATLFLDEVALLSLETQGKLLRVLEDGCFDMVGGRTQQVDVRLIVASNIELAEAVKRGTFREDLYYRLCTIVLRSPPLRDRKADIKTLAEHFLDDAASRHGKTFSGFSTAAIKYLEGLYYPGNVRELRQLVEAAAIFAEQDGVIDRELLTTGGHVPQSQSNQQQISAAEIASTLLASGVSMQELERACIEQALTESGGNLSQAARLLGISRRQVEYRVKGS